MFKRTNKKTKTLTEPLPVFRRDPFAAVPVKNERAEVREDSQGLYQVRMNLDPEKGLQGFLSQKLGFHKDVRVDLDEQGTFYWSRVNGQRNLGEIEKQVADHFNLDRDTSRKATMIFTKMLMVRHLIHLQVQAETTENTEASGGEISHAG